MLTGSTPGWPGDGSVPGVPVASPETLRTSPEFRTVFGCGAWTLIVGWAVGAIDLLLDGNNTNDVSRRAAHLCGIARRSGRDEAVQQCVSLRATQPVSAERPSTC